MQNRWWVPLRQAIFVSRHCMDFVTSSVYMILFLSCENLDFGAGYAIQIVHSRDYKPFQEYVIPHTRIFHVARMNGAY
jgi:hypothetical protein